MTIDSVVQHVLFPRAYAIPQVQRWLAHLKDALEIEIDAYYEHHERIRKLTAIRDSHIRGRFIDGKVQVEFNCYNVESPRTTFEGCGFSVVNRNDHYVKASRWNPKAKSLTKRIEEESKNYFKKK